MEKILFGLNLNNDMLDGVKGELTSLGIEFGESIPETDYKRTKNAIIKALVNKDCSYTVCILSESLQRSDPFTTDDFDYIRTENENTLIIPIVRDAYKGTDFMKKLEAVGITGALFDADATMTNIAEIIKNRGRARKFCKIYYNIESGGVKEAEAAADIVDPAEMVRQLNAMDSPMSAVERAESIMNMVSPQQFTMCLSKAEPEVREELIKSGKFDIYFPEEVIKRQVEAVTKEKEGNKKGKEAVKPKVVIKEVEKVVEKEVVKEVVKHEVKFVDVSETIGVIGLTSESGSTFVALNLARELSMKGLKPTLVQLPNTESDLYERLQFAETFGTEFVSHIAEVASGSQCSDKRNEYFDINFCVPNPYTDLWTGDSWGNEETYRLLLSISSPKVVDFGSYYAADGCLELIPYLKHLIVVIDSTIAMNEDDFKYVRDLRRDYSNINISFVINRCSEGIPDDLTRFIGNEFRTLMIPAIDNSVFDNAGSDIVYPYYQENLAQLSDLVGFGPMGEVPQSSYPDEAEPAGDKAEKKNGKKKRRSRDALNTVHERMNMVTVEVGVGGVCSGVGTTHTALMLAYSLSSKYKVAIVEQNHPYDNARGGHVHTFANIYRNLYPDTYINSNVIPRFTYKGIDFYPYCNYAQFSARFRDNYDFVIVDYGNEMADENFFRMGKRIVVASAAEWKIVELKRYVKEVALKNSLESSINYLITFMPRNKMSEIRKICSVGGARANVYEVPVCPDWDMPTAQMEIIFNDILTNNQRRKRKMLFGLSRN